ncbi:MAG: TrkA family potassium uptake protein [Deltaproteobacteria bacterium]|nr:TrkA family potassium uptake protein [Deltaproteobacteria bacterium]
MRRFAVIGLGHFGFNVARRLYDDGHEVIAIDMNKDLIREVKPFCSQSVMADASDRETLEAIGIEEVDVAVVSLGEKLDASILVTLYLKEMGISQIVVKALTDDHARVLKIIGATDIVFPEKDMAIRVAERLSTPTVIDQVEFMEGYSVVEIEAPKKFWGVALRDAEIRHTYGLSVILIRKKGGKGDILISPKAIDVIDEGDVLVLLGEDGDIEKFKALSG